MKILVLGGGAHGRVIAADLALAVPRALVRVADIADPVLPAISNLEQIHADLSDFSTVARLMREHDLAVGALPSRYGFGVLQAAVEAKRNLIDVSFAADDPFVLERDALAADITIVPDCGVSPGLSNLLIGRAVATHGAPDEITILAGGVSEDPWQPYGYVVTWSLEDQHEVYTRPAHIVRGGRPAIAPPFSGVEQVEVDGLGTMEAFYSDGLRSLLRTVPGVRDMGEKTLRWPGHADAVQPLVASGELIDELRARCIADPPRDILAMVVRLGWGEETRQVTLVDRYDPNSGLTAMARTSALTTAAVARLAIQRGLGAKGVRPLELLGQEEWAYRFVMDTMAGHGVKLDADVFAQAA